MKKTIKVQAVEYPTNNSPQRRYQAQPGLLPQFTPSTQTRVYDIVETLQWPRRTRNGI
jgi:hypothetical protein